jgi:lysophospholipase L1-like esterase
MKKIITILLLLVLGAAFVIIKAPHDRLTSDQKELKQTLKTNAQQAKIEQKKQTGITQTEQSKVLFIGDSVMLGAYQELNNAFEEQATIDAKESRQISDLPQLLESYSNLETYSTIVIGLGTNGIISDEYLTATMDKLADKKVYWINLKCPNDWQDSVNEKLAALPAQYSNLTIVDWFDQSKDQPSYFYDDQTHLNGVGRKAYAQLLKSTVMGS